ncbi:DNA polymerase-4 [Hasllibacter halocynthiae]|uniref:DNA polymerase IV n=2 Tax=Hasllibacter halocynthiae TaxID=595589 RepID=A0A2T0X3Q1_9RHOB|nr:DNA polymerase-4 [Hasllibacter halocynthiae]
MLSHPELFTLSVAHMDCDAFYASVEKRDEPSLRDKPVIVGGGRRGVVTTACYIARIRGVRSAMPMFQALRLCPEAVIVKPSFPKYVEASRAIRTMMDDMTPAIEPLSLDEAFLDLGGTARLHGAPPAVTLCRLLNRMEGELGLSGSVGLSHNKFLAKLASDLDKPRGFSVIGAAETERVLAPLPVAKIWGAGPVMQGRLEKAGVRTFADLRRWDPRDLAARFGSGGERLADLSRGIDRRAVKPDRAAKSISNETTFTEDTADPEVLDGHIWRMADKVAGRAKAKGLAGRVVMLKLKRANHALLTRRVTLPAPTQLADAIYRHARALFDETPQDGPYRLLGVGIAEIVPEALADRTGDLLDPAAPRRAAAERATDAIRARFGETAIQKGRALR